MIPPTRAAAPPLFIVANVGSGHGDAATTRVVVTEACADAGRALHWLVVDDPKRIGSVAIEAVRLARQVSGIVVAAGGDGTINAVAQATLGSGCAFGVLPQGTFNYFSRTHGIPADTASAMQVLLHEAAAPVQVGLVNEQLFLVNASLGLYPTLLEDREAWKRQLGRSRLVAFGAGLLTMLRGARSLHLHIEVQGQVREVRTPTLFVGNNGLQLAQLGFPEAQAVERGELAAIVLRPVGRLRILALVLRGALGQLGNADQVLSFPFRELVVRRARGFGRRRVKVATDGEITWQSQPLRFRVSPTALLLIRPAAAGVQGVQRVQAVEGDKGGAP